MGDAKYLKVKVKPGSSESSLRTLDDGTYLAMIKEKPEKGRANKELINLVSKTFGVSRDMVSIVRGNKSREKILRIEY